MSATNSTSIQKLIVFTMILLLILDAIFLLGKFMPNIMNAQIQPIYLELLANKGFLIVLEFLAAISLVVDVINRFDLFSAFAKFVRCTLTAIIVIVFFAKVFVLYIDSALLTA